MKKINCIILCVFILLIGIQLGCFIHVYLDKTENHWKPTYPVRDEDYLCDKKYETVKLGEFNRIDVQNNDAYLLANDLIADAYNSPDNYVMYDDIISYDDFYALIPYIAGDGTNTKPKSDDVSDFYLYNICEFKYTKDRAIISFSFDYYQYDKSDCRKAHHITGDSAENPVRLYMKVSDGKWTVDHIYDPP